MSMSSGDMPSGSRHSNACNRDASMKGTARSASGRPGHNLLPDPNGIGGDDDSLCKKRSGRNWSGLSHAAGSRMIAHALKITVVREARRVALVEALLAAERVHHLRPHLGHHAGIAKQLGHRPLHGSRHRVGASRKDVEQKVRDVVAWDLAGGGEADERVQEVAVLLLVRVVVTAFGHAAIDYVVQQPENDAKMAARLSTQTLQVELPEEREKVGHVGARNGCDDVLYQPV
uniref:Uncharacterized protein n=1 Tax=Oryza glumipatula TaxID=40148 RepID=A0A0D9YTY2_9ORYZ